MTELAQRFKDRLFSNDAHPYRLFEVEVERHLRPGMTLMDAGCGRTAPVLAKYRSRVGRLIGVDLVDFDPTVTGIQLLREDLSRTSVASGTVDLVMSRSVMEHVAEPEKVYAEMYRVLRPGGLFVFITANLWDYASLISRVVPNRLHPWIVSKVEGREEHDVFPIQYKTNTHGAVKRFAHAAGFEVASLTYHGQYPSYFMFNGALFLVASGYEKLISRYETLGFLRGWIFAVLRKPANSGQGTPASVGDAAK
jgi:SAM-dependent methyltransferase